MGIEVTELEGATASMKELKKFLYLQQTDKRDESPKKLKRQLLNRYSTRERKVFIVKDKDAIKGVLAAKLTGNPKVGVLGSFKCVNDEAISRQLFDYGVNFFLQRNVKTIIGPVSQPSMDGYRFCLTDSPEPLFLFEPTQPAYYPKLWESYGFTPYLDYSAIKFKKISQFEKKWDDFYLEVLDKGFYIKRMKPIGRARHLKRLITSSLENKEDQEVMHSCLSDDERLLRTSLNKIIKQGFSYCIYKNNGKAVGFVLAGRDKEQLNVYEARVALEHQKQGMGRALFYHLFKQALMKGLESCLLCMIRNDLVGLTQFGLEGGETLKDYCLYQFNLP